MAKNPFGDEPVKKEKLNPFGEDADDGSIEGAAYRIEQAARKIRNLRLQIGAEGLTLTATRDLIDELTASLDAMTRALRTIAGGKSE